MATVTSSSPSSSAATAVGSAEQQLLASIAELEPRLASAEAALAQWLKIIPWSGFFPNPSRSHFEKYPEAKV